MQFAPPSFSTGLLGNSWPPRIIVLDDDRLVLEILCEALSVTGAIVTPVTTADAALDAMGEPPRPSMLITDIDLGPGPDGFAVAEHARIRWPNMPIFLISGHYNGNAKLEASLRATFFPKPLRLRPFIAAVSAALPAEPARASS